MKQLFLVILLALGLSACGDPLLVDDPPEDEVDPVYWAKLLDFEYSMYKDADGNKYADASIVIQNTGDVGIGTFSFFLYAEFAWIGSEDGLRDWRFQPLTECGTHYIGVDKSVGISCTGLPITVLPRFVDLPIRLAPHSFRHQVDSLVYPLPVDMSDIVIEEQTGVTGL